MDKKITIKDKILSFIAKKGIRKTDFFEATGIQSSNFKGKNLESQPGGEMIVKILSIYPDLSADWLLRDQGDMLKTKCDNIENTSAVQTISNSKDKDKILTNKEKNDFFSENEKIIPLVSQTVAAGFGNENFAITEQDVKEFYNIPCFRHTHVDFMIEVTGDSMTPHLNSGDIIACTIVRDSNFIQWNKTHVIATKEQGLLVKRLMPANDDKHLKAVSDNTQYPPFDIPKNEITGIALVIGAVCLE